MNPHFSASNDSSATKVLEDRPGSFHRILVADDDDDIRQLCVGALTRSGYQVDSAEDGAAGWQALQANGYNLLVTDNEMPKISGIELVKKLRAARMDLAVVLTSGVIPTEEIGRDPSLRLAATLQKPFMIGELVDTVEKVLKTVDITRDRSQPTPTHTGVIVRHPCTNQGDQAPSPQEPFPCKSTRDPATVEELERLAIVLPAIAPSR